jgi:hypothetical protein
VDLQLVKWVEWGAEGKRENEDEKVHERKEGRCDDKATLISREGKINIEFLTNDSTIKRGG